MAKTYTIKKDSIRTGMHTPLTDILIRNGKFAGHLIDRQPLINLGFMVFQRSGSLHLLCQLIANSQRYMDAYELTPALAFWLITPYLNESDHFAEPSGSASSEASRGSLNFRGFSGSILRNLDAIPDVNSMPGRQQEDDVACEDTLVAGVRGPSTPSYTVSAPPDDATISLSE
ncbi:hypothetical protein BN946_scf184813.g2 [Trametes cinnabarina]|uniref:Uncharacterized protein n=1 Tax=Pycnoporus cinnabarinus TaxID=5643 RepID=A0A060SQB3_PYCCI|nr:hypothetical protein BN946_scf184813.g2 [Trametes cinnabarina]